jgi:hypothetical protein
MLSTSQTFGDLFNEVMSNPSPVNLEHRQARAREIHDAAERIVRMGDFTPQQYAALPRLGTPYERTSRELWMWWEAFAAWLDDMPIESWAALSNSPVI